MPDNKPAAYGKNAVGRPRTKGRAKALKTDNDPRLLAARHRHVSRDTSNSMRYAKPEIVEAGGIGSAIRAVIKAATRKKYPKFAPKKASLEDKIKYREDRAKALRTARDKRNAKVQARKEERLAKWRAKKDKMGQRPKKSKFKPTPGTKEFYEEKALRTPSYIRERREVIAANNRYRDRAARIHEQKYQDARAKAAKDAEAVERIRLRAMRDRKPKGSGTPGGYRRGY